MKIVSHTGCVQDDELSVAFRSYTSSNHSNGNNSNNSFSLSGILNILQHEYNVEGVGCGRSIILYHPHTGSIVRAFSGECISCANNTHKGMISEHKRIHAGVHNTKRRRHRTLRKVQSKSGLCTLSAVRHQSLCTVETRNFP